METEIKETVIEKEQKVGVKNTLVGKKTAKNCVSVYTSKELADNAMTLFGVRKECVLAALKAANITAGTVSETKEIVLAFMKKEVK